MKFWSILLWFFNIALFVGFLVYKILYHVYLSIYPYILNLSFWNLRFTWFVQQKDDIIDVEKGLWTYQKSEPIPLDKHIHNNGVYIHDTIPKELTATLTHSMVNKHNDFVNDIPTSTNFVSLKNNNNNRVLIVGGGFGGTVVAQLLEAAGIFEVTMLDNKNYFEYKPSLPKLIQNPYHSRIINIEHKSFLKNVNFIETSVTQIVNNQGVHVHLKDGEMLSLYKDFDYLVICTGATYAFEKIPSSSLLEEHSSYEGLTELVPTDQCSAIIPYLDTQILNNYSHIVVIGGGPTGVEVAAELLEKGKAEDIPDLILVHSASRLLNTFSMSASNYVEDYFKNKNIQIITGQRGQFIVNGTVHPGVPKGKCDGVMIQGKVLQNALVFICTGPTPNLPFLKKTEWPLDNYGYLKVNQYLQVSDSWNSPSHGRIMACGDIIAVPDPQKLAQSTEIQASIVVNNLYALMKNRTLTEYIPKERIVVVSLGKYDGIVCWYDYALRGFISCLLKEVIEWKTMLRYWPWSRWWNPFYNKSTFR